MKTLDVKVLQPNEYKCKIAQLKAFKNGKANILLQRIIKQNNDLELFQESRVVIIETFKNDFDSFETILINEV
jgi:hypothetical protein